MVSLSFRKTSICLILMLKVFQWHKSLYISHNLWHISQCGLSTSARREQKIESASSGQWHQLVSARRGKVVRRWNRAWKGRNLADLVEKMADLRLVSVEWYCRYPSRYISQLPNPGTCEPVIAGTSPNRPSRTVKACPKCSLNPTRPAGFKSSLWDTACTP